jgi:hypothetical protein
MDDLDVPAGPQARLHIHQGCIFLVLNNDLKFSVALVKVHDVCEKLPCSQMTRYGNKRPLLLKNFHELRMIHEFHAFIEKTVVNLSPGKGFHIGATDMVEILSGQESGFPVGKAQMKRDGFLSELAASWKAGPQDLAQEITHELQTG